MTARGAAPSRMARSHGEQPVPPAPFPNQRAHGTRTCAAPAVGAATIQPAIARLAMIATCELARLACEPPTPMSPCASTSVRPITPGRPVSWPQLFASGERESNAQRAQADVPRWNGPSDVIRDARLGEIGDDAERVRMGRAGHGDGGLSPRRQLVRRQVRRPGRAARGPLPRDRARPARTRPFAVAAALGRRRPPATRSWRPSPTGRRSGSGTASAGVSLPSSPPASPTGSSG